MAKNAQNIRNAKSANIEMWPILIPPDDHWPQNMWKTKENTMECLRKNRAEWKSTKKHPKNYFLKTFPKNILFFGQNYPKICTKKDFKKNWLVTYTLGWICSGRSVIYPSLCRKGWVKISWTSEFRWWAVKKTTNVEITCLKMQMIGLEKYRNSFGRNPALLQKKRWYHLIIIWMIKHCQNC